MGEFEVSLEFGEGFAPESFVFVTKEDESTFDFLFLISGEFMLASFDGQDWCACGGQVHAQGEGAIGLSHYTLMGFLVGSPHGDLGLVSCLEDLVIPLEGDESELLGFPLDVCDLSC